MIEKNIKDQDLRRMSTGMASDDNDEMYSYNFFIIFLSFSIKNSFILLNYTSVEVSYCNTAMEVEW